MADGHKPLMRSLGEFVGHILAGVRSNPASPTRVETRRSVEERTEATARGPVTLRRTTIEEVVLPPDASGSDGAHPSPPRESEPR